MGSTKSDAKDLTSCHTYYFLRCCALGPLPYWCWWQTVGGSWDGRSNSSGRTDWLQAVCRHRWWVVYCPWCCYCCRARAVTLCRAHGRPRRTYCCYLLLLLLRQLHHQIQHHSAAVLGCLRDAWMGRIESEQILNGKRGGESLVSDRRRLSRAIWKKKTWQYLQNEKIGIWLHTFHGWASDSVIILEGECSDGQQQ